MQLTLDDLDHAADLLVHTHATWAAPPWLFAPRPGGPQLSQDRRKPYIVERTESVSSGNQFGVLAMWKQHCPQPDLIQCWFSEKPGSPRGHPLFVERLAARFPRVGLAERARAA